MAQEKKSHRRHSRKDSHKSSKPRSAGFCKIMKNFLLDFWIFVHGLIDYVIDLCFGLYYGQEDAPNQKMPPVQESFLLESAVSIAEKIRNREVSSEAVVQACYDRINAVNPMLNAVVDMRYKDAIEEARIVDRLLTSGSLTAEDIKKKPFLGVPFTTKESTSCKGLRYSLGLVSRKHVRSDEDAEVIRLLKNSGAILIANTNIPVVNLWVETGNKVYGYTNNPYNLTRTVGGSSGGEAAIVAAAGSTIGLGTDIGGSIRMPAFFCGVFGHKPTTGLISLRGLTRRTGEEDTSMVCVGPISRYAQDLKPFLKVLLAENVSRLPKLDDKVSLEELRVFYMTESRDVRASPVSRDLRTALDNVVNHLSTKSQHSVEKLELADMQYSYRIWRHWQLNEPGPSWAVEIADRKGKVSVWAELFKFITLQSEFTLAALLKLVDSELLPRDKPEWAIHKTEALKKQLEDTLGENGVLIYPSHSFPASYHYSSYLRPFNFGYWSIFNALHLPVTQVPLGLNPSGLPVGVQVVAGPYQDHLCIAVAQELQKTFGGWVPPFKI